MGLRISGAILMRGDEGAPGVDQAEIYARLVPRERRKPSQVELDEPLHQTLSAVGGATASVFTSGFGGAFKQISLDLRFRLSREGPLDRGPERCDHLGPKLVRFV